MNFSDRVKSLRTELNLTQKELANKINSSASKVGMWEAGKRDPGTDDLIILCEIFNVSTDYILGNSDIRNPYESKQEKKVEGTNIDLWLSKTDGYKELPDEDKELISSIAKNLLEKHRKEK